MKKLLFLLFCVTSLSALAQKSADKQAILNLLEQQRKGWNDGDLDLFMQGYLKSDSLLFVGSSGPTYGWQQTLDNYKRTYPSNEAMGQLTFNIKSVEFLSDKVAFVLGGWHLKRKKDEPKGYFTLLLKKIKGEWKIVVDHSS